MLVFQYCCSLVSSFSFWSWKTIFSTAVFPQGKDAFTVCAVFTFFMSHSRRTDHKQKNASCLCSLVLLPNSLWDNTAEFGALELFEIWLFTRPVKHFSIFLGDIFKFWRSFKRTAYLLHICRKHLEWKCILMFRTRWLNWCWSCEQCLYLNPVCVWKGRDTKFQFQLFCS